MKQNTGNEQLAKHVQDIHENLEAFHEEMMHQLTKSFQEKTTYLSTCMQQLKHEELREKSVLSTPEIQKTCHALFYINN
jgi:predicted transcriptional regulator